MSDNSEYKIPLGLDIKNALKDVQTLKTSLSALNKEGSRIGKNMTTQFQSASTQSANLSRNVVQNAKTFQQATTEAERFNSTIRNLNGEFQNLNRSSSKTSFGGMTEGIRSANSSGSSFLGTLRNIGGALGIAFGVQQVIAFGRELVDIARKAEGVKNAFNRLEGDSVQNLNKLRTAVKNTVGDLTLMQVAVRADNFKIPLDVLAQGLAFAQQRAVDTGMSVDYLVNSFVDGIGRKSTLVLDNLGISASELQEEVKRVGDFAEAVGNIIQRSMSESSTYVDDFGSRVNRLSTYWENAKLSMSNFTADLLTEITDVVTSDSWGEFWDRISSWGSGRYVTQAKNLAKTFEEVGKTLPFSGMTSDFEIYNRVKAGEDFNKMYNDAQANYKRMQKAHEEYLNGVKLGNLKENKRTVDDYKRQEQNAKQHFETIARVGKDYGFGQNAKGVKLVIDTEAVDQLKKKLEDLTEKRDASQSIAEINGLNKQIEAVEANIDRLTNKRTKANKDAERLQKKAESEQKKAIDREKQVANERIRIENETLQLQVDLIEDKVTQAVAKETTESQSRVRILENRKKEFPELVKQINALIEAEELASQSRVTEIIKKGEEEQRKEVLASQVEIRRVLKSDYEVQIADVEAKYSEIIKNAKEAGTFTASIEKDLEVQKQKDISKISLEEAQKRLDLQEEFALNAIYQRKRIEGQSEESFERENQKKILEVFIQFAEQRLKLVQNDPAKIAEVNDLLVAIKEAKKELNEIGKEQKGDLFELLGIDKQKISDYADAVSKTGEIVSDLFQGFADGAIAKVEKIREEIDAIDELIAKQEEAVNKEKELMDKGFANDYENQRKTLEMQKQNREQLLKQEEEAQKKAQALQRAQLIADSVAQAGNLITASTEIFKTFSKISIVGIPLAIAMIGTMFGAFAVSKANAVKNTKLAEGGLIGGKSHAEGGNKFVSMDGNSFMEHERGEFVVKKSSTQKYRSVIEAINKDDFSNISMNDISLRALLEGTGVTEHVEVAKKAGENNIMLVRQSRSFTKQENIRLEEIHETLKEFFQHTKDKPEVTDFGDYIEIKKGNKIERIWKK